ncbi:MAG TPA: 4a-hydroxytetrahydrobiopterin dehydratase [Gemmatimonadales bacterium]|jgi:4a-hydroxytetrahydrobiopterin dehydratase|nr:4a-hydroxytetrahydrobiopterin dehydratase [Gemmatimonadales bacterium]
MSEKERAFSEAEISEQLGKLKGWHYEHGALRRTYQTDGWRGSMLVAGAIAFLCESADHHADLTVTWPSVSVALSTHSAGGITAKDFEVAGLIQALVLWKPPAHSSLKGPAKPFVRE